MLGAMRRITLITTGGTIEKTYDDRSGQLENRGSIVRRMLGRLRLEDAGLEVVELMSKDSLHLTDADRDAIAAAVQGALGAGAQGVVVLHGTDTLHETGARLLARVPQPAGPVILTGAWRPFEMKRSDALQNLTESIFAAGVLAPGVYAVAHGRALPFPGVRKDRERRTFVTDGASSG
jgi:L-asparaginase